MFSWDAIEHICVSIAAVGAAITYIYKALSAIKKPADNLEERLQHIEGCLDNDNKRLKDVDEFIDTCMEFLKLLVKSTEVELEHMETNNATGKLAAMRQELNQFMIHKSFDI